jgi:hypothetical protein
MTPYPSQEAIVQERRKVRRFEVEWEIVLKGKNGAGLSFDAPGGLINLSSRGAFLRVSKNLTIGTKVQLWIKVPFEKELWMKYSGEVIRLDDSPGGTGLGLKFSTVRPRFANSMSIGRADS